jgi:hypothetical protein
MDLETGHYSRGEVFPYAVELRQRELCGFLALLQAGDCERLTDLDADVLRELTI